MSTSLPSKTIFAVDVPEVTNFVANFRYNFFTPDEQVRENSGIPNKLLGKSTGETDTDTIQFFEIRVPRHIIFTWSNPHIKDSGNSVTQSDMIKRATRPAASRRTIIADNYKKIVTEDHFSAFNYIAVNFHDGEIQDKVYNFVSGSYLQHAISNPKDGHISPHKAAASLQSSIPNSIKPDFVHRAMAQPAASFGASFYNNKVNGISGQEETRSAAVSSYYKKLHDVYVNAQINSKFFHDITARNIQDPHSPFALNMHSLHKITKKLSSSAKQRIGQAISEAEFKTVVPYVNLRVNKTSHHQQRTPAEIVGYVIDKYEILPGGVYKQLPPIIIENSEGSLAIDSSVKYGQQYCYDIRTIALFNLPAIDADTGDVATIEVLISSKPSTKQYVKIVDNTAPPVPTDINFTWDYERDKLLIHWTFPPNKQRDIKRFQVFRRKNIDNPFELLKEYDFDDSAVRSPQRERPDNRVVERVTSPVTFYIDDDFVKSSKYIYTVCCIDAHGLTSCYGAQYELSFDIFKNQLEKRLISHSGAPKPYPNLYLPGSGFVDVVRVGGPSSKKMSVYFTPQYYQLEDDKNRSHRILATNQTNGYYKLNFINVDNQKSDSLTIRIDDRVRVAQSKISFPKFRFNVPKMVNNDL